MKKIKQTYHIKAPIRQVWQAFIDTKAIDQWGGGPARMDDKVGTKFELWGGDIRGTNTEVIKERKLAQDWYEGDWPQPSKLVFTLEKEEEGTKVVMVQTDVPDDEADDIRQGWRDFYMGPMKQWLEGK